MFPLIGKNFCFQPCCVNFSPVKIVLKLTTEFFEQFVNIQKGNFLSLINAGYYPMALKGCPL